MNATERCALIRSHLQPLDPLPTNVPPRLQRLPGIRGVVFDIYGTLLISGCGDVGTTAMDARPSAFVDALQMVDLTTDITAEAGIARLNDAIDTAHELAKQTGVDHPEIDIREIWRHVLDELRSAERLDGPSIDDIDVERLALEYELRVNPVWPMPGCAETLDRLQDMGQRLGIISNAQFYTPPMFDALLGRELNEFGFDPELCVYSFEHRRGKPGRFLYDISATRFAEQGYEPHELLYVGNDMLKDVWPAQHIGFRTALFAGDARSLRLREDDTRIHDVKPDIVVTELVQLLECI